jgi:hypothetical protein
MFFGIVGGFVMFHLATHGFPKKKDSPPAPREITYNKDLGIAYARPPGPPPPPTISMPIDAVPTGPAFETEDEQRIKQYIEMERIIEAEEYVGEGQGFMIAQ